MTTDHASATLRSCPSDEFLVAALTECITDAEQQWLDAHLDVCDRCLDAVGASLRRLHIADEIPTAVPAAVRRRAAAATLEPAATLLPGLRPVSHPTPAQPPTAQTTDWQAADTRHPHVPPFDFDRLSGRLLSLVSRVWRQPVMIPVALAAAAMLVVGTQTWMTSSVPRPLTRSIALPQHVRVTAVEAAVRLQPNGHAEVVATITRGTLVEISGQERDWSRVTLPDGTEGWVDQGALR